MANNTPEREAEIHRAGRARQILGNPLWIEATESIRSDLRRVWVDSPARDVEGREAIWVMQKMLDRLVKHFEDIETTGKLAQIQLSERSENE